MEKQSTKRLYQCIQYISHFSFAKLSTKGKFIEFEITNGVTLDTFKIESATGKREPYKEPYTTIVILFSFRFVLYI